MLDATELESETRKIAWGHRTCDTFSRLTKATSCSVVNSIASNPGPYHFGSARSRTTILFASRDERKKWEEYSHERHVTESKWRRGWLVRCMCDQCNHDEKPVPFVTLNIRIFLVPFCAGSCLFFRYFTWSLVSFLFSRVETNCSFVISNSSSSNERIFEYFRILDRKVVAKPMFEIPIGQEVKYNIP